jgi:hypothetical protein
MTDHLCPRSSIDPGPHPGHLGQVWSEMSELLTMFSASSRPCIAQRMQIVNECVRDVQDVFNLWKPRQRNRQNSEVFGKESASFQPKYPIAQNISDIPDISDIEQPAAQFLVGQRGR